MKSAERVIAVKSGVGGGVFLPKVSTTRPKILRLNKEKIQPGIPTLGRRKEKSTPVEKHLSLGVPGKASGLRVGGPHIVQEGKKVVP